MANPVPRSKPVSYAEAISLPPIPCTLDGTIEASADPRIYFVPLYTSIGASELSGYAMVPDTAIAASIKEDPRVRTPVRVPQQQPALLKSLEITEEDDDAFVIASKVKLGDSGNLEYDGVCKISQRDIPGELLQPWLATTSEAIMETMEAKLDPELEKQRQHVRSVRVLGQLALGARRGTSLRVEMRSLDGETSLEAAAKIVGNERDGIGYLIRLRVKMAEGTFMYLRGWVHAEALSGRFEEGTPGELAEE